MRMGFNHKDMGVELAELGKYTNSSEIVTKYLLKVLLWFQFCDFIMYKIETCFLRSELGFQIT